MKAALNRYAEAISETPLEHPGLGLLYLEKVDVSIQMGVPNESFDDLILAKGKILELDGEFRKDLEVIFNRLLSHMPEETWDIGFTFPIKSADAVEAVPEPVDSVPEEAPHRRERALGRRVLRPQALPAET